MAILTSVSPNTESDDVNLAARLISTPWRWGEAASIATVEDELTRRFGRQVILVSSGRQALTEALKSHGLGEGDEVIIQAFTCLAVPQAVRRAGATPIYADIDPKTYNLDPASVASHLTPRTRALVVQHTFGYPAPLTELQTLAHHHHLVLIEDCAHALGSRLGGELLGTIGEVAVVSFGRDKALSSVFGGAVLTSSADVAARVRERERARVSPPPQWVAQQLVHPLIMSVAKPLYFTARVGQGLIALSRATHLISLSVTAAERAGHQAGHLKYRYSPALAQLLRHQLNKLDQYVARRQAIVSQYRQHLPAEALPPDDRDVSWLRLPVRVVDQARVLAAARSATIELGDWYSQPVYPATADARYQAGSCPHAEATCRTVVNLPTYPSMSQDDVAKVATCVAPHLVSAPAR